MDNTDLALMVGRFEAKQDEALKKMDELRHRFEDGLADHTRRIRSLEQRRNWWRTAWTVLGGGITLTAGWVFGAHK